MFFFCFFFVFLRGIGSCVQGGRPNAVSIKSACLQNRQEEEKTFNTRPTLRTLVESWVRFYYLKKTSSTTGSYRPRFGKRDECHTRSFGQYLSRILGRKLLPRTQWLLTTRIILLFVAVARILCRDPDRISAALRILRVYHGPRVLEPRALSAGEFEVERPSTVSSCEHYSGGDIPR
uniref:Secreted protein n=1 Tax=Compsopogon caeruleus TaxID=31354 RepID=A0A7S1TJK8_9RHOD